MSEVNAGTQARALLVDDSAVERMVGEFALKRLGYRTVVAEDCAGALRAWDDGAFALVLLDMHLPDGEGWDLAAELRRRETAGERATIVAVTGSAAPEDRERCLRAGADEYLVKPLNPAALSGVLERLRPAA